MGIESANAKDAENRVIKAAINLLENIDAVRFSCTFDMKFFNYLTTTDDGSLPKCSFLPLVIAYFSLFR
jgi:hypothetical protein